MRAGAAGIRPAFAAFALPNKGWRLLESDRSGALLHNTVGFSQASNNGEETVGL